MSYGSKKLDWTSRDREMASWEEINQALDGGLWRVLYIDNFRVHIITDEQKAALEAINTEIRFFPRNPTHIIQLADSFVIKKTKEAWISRWKKHKIHFLFTVVSPDTYNTTSGHLPNPGKRFYLRLAEDTVRDVNQQRDEKGITYVRKAMIRCGLGNSKKHLWENVRFSPICRI